jgi:opacity protein-like surface antigen
MRTITTLFCMVILTASALAQTPASRGEVFGSVGGGKAFDDEGGLGSGVDVGGGVGFRITPRFAVEGQVNRIHHKRDFSSGVRFEGIALFTTASVLYHFSDEKAQPYVLAGLGFVNYENRSRFPEDTVLPKRTSTGFATNFGTGVKLFLNQRVSIRPEFRVFFGDTAGSGVEPRFCTLRGSVAVSYHW